MTIPQGSTFCIDLHCHSTASDGTLSPQALVQRASEQGVSHLALTDHDTIEGLAEAREHAGALGLSIINGVELSCVWHRQTIHVVGLDFDHRDPEFLAVLASQHENRWRRARKIAERLSRKDPEPLLTLATEKAGGDVPGRPHFARALIEQGVVSDMNQAFNRHLGAGKPGDVKAFWPELAEVVRWVAAAGGIAVVAHPRKYKLTATKLRNLVADFKRAGGRAIEVSTSGQQSGDLGFLAELCRREELWASQGSDFHFPGAPWCELGRMEKLPAGLEPVWQHFRQPLEVASA
ncbi:PHP domain-containing protein [Marinobacter sp. SS21]|uniref:PHP domain-containing protein n=1 Tax=Marinobacter sp. SS21 TaxID=2979460 RepID=UPI00232BD3E1|nr:PHP domain-containing protein [Marinobacter sp. SS21]MDC0663445.1 PHP domain-containing protein [Marinobacter sp. SS21]